MVNVATRILGSRTIERAVAETVPLIIKPSVKSLTYRLMPEVMVFCKVCEKPEWERNAENDSGYPVSDLVSDDIAVPAGHYLIIYSIEPGRVWLTEFAHG
jgi:hypothetical protein